MSSSLNYGGHHGITLCGNDHLADNIRINTRFIHDLTVVSVHLAARVAQMALKGFVCRTRLHSNGPDEVIRACMPS